MEDTSELAGRERERAALYTEATLIVQAAEAQSRAVTAEEDARVLDLLARVRILDDQITHPRRHRALDQQEKRSDKP